MRFWLFVKLHYYHVAAAWQKGRLKWTWKAINKTHQPTQSSPLGKWNYAIVQLSGKTYLPTAPRNDCGQRNTTQQELKSSISFANTRVQTNFGNHKNNVHPFFWCNLYWLFDRLSTYTAATTCMQSTTHHMYLN